MQADLSQKEAKELLSALQCQADSWKTKPVKEDFQLCSTPRLQRTPRPYTLKGRNIRKVHSGDAIEGPIPITRKIGARQLNIQVGFTAKGERRLEIQDIARCKTTHVATDQEIAKKKNPWLQTWPNKTKAKACKEEKTTQLLPTAKPFIPTSSIHHQVPSRKSRHQRSIGNRTHPAGETNAKKPNSTMETCYSCNCPLLFALV